MLQRYVHFSGSAASASLTGTIEVTNLDTDFIAAVSTSTSTSFAQESGGTASINVGSFFSSASTKGLPFNSLHVLSGSISVPVTEAIITGSFVSGNIFGGDKYRYIESESVAVMGQSSSMFLINVTASIVPSASFGIVLVDSTPLVLPPQVTGAAEPAAPTVPTEGQIFPRGTGGN